MKRDKNLAPLSRDHHHGLITANMLKADGSKEKEPEIGLPEKADLAQSFWDTDLIFHFRNEETILYPFAKGKDELLDKMLERMLAEHASMKAMVENLGEAGDFEKVIDALGRKLEAHIRFEERELFEKIQEVFTPEELSALEGKLKSIK